MLVIVIPTRNRRALLERAVASVKAQTYPDYRVEVINDGSTDDTRAYLDSLHDPKVRVTHHDQSRGVNAARNNALRRLSKGEWAVLLDDDETLLPNALELIAGTISETPPHIQVLSFNAIMHGPAGEFPGGYRFTEGQKYYEPSYHAFMTGEGLNMYVDGENRAVLKWTLFPQYLFNEDINGFEREWWLNISHDGVGVRYVPATTIWIDVAHTGEHLSHVAAKYNPASFARAHYRIFKLHKDFFTDHTEIAQREALHSFKIAVRSGNPWFMGYFALAYLGAFTRRILAKK